MRYLGAAGLALVLALAGCGGDGSGGGTTVATAPTPSPTPSPTPNAPPPVTLADHFTFDPFVATIRVRSIVLNGDTATARPVALALDLARERTTGELTWQPQDGRYTIRTGGEQWSFGPEDRDAGNTGVERLRFSRAKPATPEGFGSIAAFLAPAKTGAYVWVGRLDERSTLYRIDYNEEETHRYLVAGQATQAGRVPASGSARTSFGFAASLPIRHYLGFLNAEGAADVDYAARTIRASFTAVEPNPIRGEPVAPLALTLDARWDALSTQIEGSLRSADGAFAGTVTGRFYGPDARDWGLVLTLASNDPLRAAAGYLVSAR